MNPALPDPDPGENGSAAEMNVRAEAKRRERVVDLARAIYVGIQMDYRRDPEEDIPWALTLAEAFETAAEAYRKNGGAK